MSANLNLASQPFRNRALPWTVAAIIIVASLGAPSFIISESRQTNAKADAVERDLRGLRQEAGVLQQQAEEIKESLTPEQRQTLEAAHALVNRKRFSWSRLFADLEASMPGSVRVTRISVRDVSPTSHQTSALLDLTVIGKTPDDVTRMISDMYRVGVFQAQPVAQNLQKGRAETGTEWTLRVLYTPRAGAPATGRSDNAIAATARTATTSSEGPQ